MQKAYLRFPDSSSLAEFLIKHKIKSAEVNPGEQKLSAPLSEEELRIATQEYGAEHKKTGVYSFFQ
jgi:hypothetical protein